MNKTFAKLISAILIISTTGCQVVQKKEVTDEEYSLIYTENTSSINDENSIAVLESNINEESSNIEVNSSILLDSSIVVEEQAESSVLNEEEMLNESQKNSIAMLNYLAVISQEINSSKNSRMFLEEAYASLINNTNPEKVNETTESHLSSLLDIIEKYRMITVKRDRLQYIYDQNKAKALKEAMPNPIGLLSAVVSLDIKDLVASALYMAVDSYSSYEAYNADIAIDFLQDGWELDDEEAANLHDSRKRAFVYMIDIVREDNLPGELALNENAVEEFVSWKNNENNYQKIQFFESEESTYEAFGNYWLVLSDCYYENEDYEKCLSALDKYETLQADIFRKDYYFAQSLPKAIAAAREVYEEAEYIHIANRYLELLIQNTEISDWSLRYFAAQMYLDLYAKTESKDYINMAFEIVLNNVNNLLAEQYNMNDTYLADVQEIEIPDYASDIEEDQIEEYNEMLHEQRETELPPIYEPLVLNLDFLFALADEMELSQSEKNRIEGILRGNGEALFLNKSLEAKYSFTNISLDFEAKYDKDEVILPVSCLSENSFMTVTVKDSNSITTYDDWEIDEVTRSKDDFDSFCAVYQSESAGDHEWNAESVVIVEIFSDETAESTKTTIEFNVSEYSDRWIIPDKVEFKQVK